ncbi:MAG TPA: PSD1 and planctomycete cytochrome C domain-containing protein [Lacipirellulaceae bacterium]|nr:PSD1 and planctomycete cytochrome C domain-containing protein [Lacipirellulaceae bacterium]
MTASMRLIASATRHLQQPRIVSLVLLLFAYSSSLGAEAPGEFFRGLNLNGPAVTIDGQAWEGSDSQNYACQDQAFESQDVPLVPATDPERAKMIRSSRWGGNRIELTNVPAGAYTVFLYVWEDNNPEIFSIGVNGRTVLASYNSGSAGHWEKLGPWYTTAREGKIVVTSQGGAANFSGIEIWKGHHDGQPPISADDLAFFEKRIRPLLVNNCYECHSAESEQPEAELLLDSRATLRRGGVHGPAVVPGDVDGSLLIAAVRYQNEDLQMPPDGKLSEEEIADLERWVKIGAPDPRSTPTKHAGKKIDIAAAREFWSLRPISNPIVPNVRDAGWPANDIDHFVLAKLEEEGLAPAPDADKRALIRRATYDLTGLPPTPEEVEAFLADDSDAAFARVVERLLASPRYGERWGRHWLDVVRYADTAGDNSDYPVPQMHRYRDWVINALNHDLPFDEFVRDQLAGDLRGGASEEERCRRIVATGYIAASRRFGSRVNDYPQHLTIEDTLDNLGRAFLGMTLACARCHDHKFDPITSRDYYALYGIFQSTRYPWPGIELDKRQRDFVPLIPAERLAELEKAQRSRNDEQKRLDAEVEKLKKQLENAKDATDAEKQKLEKKLKRAERRAIKHREQPPLFDTAYAVADAEQADDAAIHLRGDPARPGEVVRRRFLEVLGGEELPDGYEGSGREQLAEWILSADNPLPARVMVNRIWHHHFGQGIVPTTNDFGRQGKPPSHPELLDYLAQAFRDGGWSIKSMHRMIMTSRTYRQSTAREELAVSVDPANQWLSGYTRRRLDAESIRDTMLVVGGNLDLSPAGPHPFPPEPSWDFTQHKPFKDVYDTNRRSVYLMTQRIQRHPYLAIFDGADPSASTGERMTSTTPLQALYLMNDPFLHEQARRVAERIMHHAPDDERRTAYAYELLLARPPMVDEQTQAKKFLEKARKLLQNNKSAVADLEVEAWSAYVRSLFRLNEFVYLD